MLYKESLWLAQNIHTLPLPATAHAVNLGSQNQEFMEHGQPWINSVFLAELKTQGVRVTNIDLQKAPGVDLVGDLMDKGFQEHIRQLHPTIVIVCNILEHVTNRGELALAIQDIVPEDGYLVVSCPKDYPFHPDPIDNGFRPTLNELTELFPGLQLVMGEEVLCEGSEIEMRAGRYGFAGKIARLLVPFIRPKGWLDTVRRLPWLFKNYRATCAILTKPLPKH
jgi:hypothetical protein